MTERSEDLDHEFDRIVMRVYEDLEKGIAPDRVALLADYPQFERELHSFLNDLGILQPAELLPGNPRALTQPVDDTVSQGMMHPGDSVYYIGQYRILREIARGGMGVVYQAYQQKLRRTVALKMILAGEIADQHLVERFRSEAEAAARLDHPGIVPIFEIGEHQGRHYFSMGFVEGISLAERLREGPLPPKQATTLLIKICDAIGYAHEQHVIHRDLKPGNVLIDQSENPRVTDFGLAKRIDTDSELTRSGQVLGTPAYMPPEQAAGKADEIGILSDVYSLGATLYATLTGHPPFQAATAVETIRQVIEREPLPPRMLNAQIPKDLNTICLKCLRKEPRKRYADAHALAQDLHRFLGGQPILARPTPRAERVWKWCKRNPRTVTAAMLACVLLTVVTLVVAAERRKNTATLAKIAVASLTSTRGVISPPLLEDFPREIVLNELNARMSDADYQNKLPVAFALAHFEHVPVGFLVESVEEAVPNESINFLKSLAGAKRESLRSMIDAARRCDEQTAQVVNTDSNSAVADPQNSILRYKARLAILSLRLGDTSIAAEMCQLAPDPIQRTIFIDECSSWYGDLEELCQIARAIDDGPLRSGLCLAIGGVSPRLASSLEKTSVQSLITDWYMSMPDSGTHSASEWALRKWGFPVPAVSGSVPQAASRLPKQDRQWHVNSVGMTMVRIPAGIFLTEYGEPIQIRDILMSDREIDVGTFQMFESECNYYSRCSGASPRHPAANIHAYDAMFFCNWLSQKERLRSCYRRTGEVKRIDVGAGSPARQVLVELWQVDLDANGYRLATVAEWDHACQAGAATRYSFGELDQWSKDYGVLLNKTDRSEPCGSKMPNGWGLFDLHGNVSELCNAPLLEVFFARGSSFKDSYHRRRGGAFAPTYSNHWTGFRVVKLSTDDTAEDRQNSSKRASADPVGSQNLNDHFGQ